MRTKMFLAAGAVLATAALTLAGCSAGTTVADTDTDAPIIIGAAVASSGILADYDQPPLNGLKLRLDEINAAGGIDGHEVKIIEEDTQSDIEQGATVATSLIQKGADIIVSSCDFDFGGPAATVAQQAGILSFSLCAASPKFGVQGIGDLAFTPRGSIASESAVLADFAMGKDWTSVQVLLDDSFAATSGLCSAFIKFFESEGGTITGTTNFLSTDTSFTSQAEAVKSSGADAVILCGLPPSGASVLRQLRASGVELPVLAGDPFDGSYWTETVPDISNLFAITAASIFGDSAVEGANDFFASYEKTYGDLPIRGDAVYGYAIAQLIEAAIAGSDDSTDGKTLATYLETNTVPTLIGDYTYDSETHISLTEPYEILEFDNGAPHSVGVFTSDIDVKITDGV